MLRGSLGESRFNPMSGSWPMVFFDLFMVVGLAAAARAVSMSVSSPWLSWLIFIGATALLVFVFVAVPLRVLLMTQRGQSRDTTKALRMQNERQEFDASLGRALEMADAEPIALSMAARALGMCGDDIHASVLLADNSDAHLQTVVTTQNCSEEHSCEVATPHGCPAIRYGHTMIFATSDQLDCCPHLIERGVPSLAAVCVPVSVVGRATGVVHVVRDGQPFDAVERSRVEAVARQSGQRVGMLRATAQTQLQASTDPLTGLYNRRSMENSVRQLSQNNVPYSVAILDLDHFKVLNDTYGHDTGDRALRLFARTLRNTVRAGDLVSRHGGEEFVIVLPNVDSDTAMTVVDRVRLELLGAVSDGRTPSFTVSAGISDTTESDDYQQLLGLADERLLAAKRGGRNMVLTRLG
jgi:diguanylate cyclase (GGDEF)-like protein